MLQYYRDQKWGWQAVTTRTTEMTLDEWDALLTALDENPNRWDAHSANTVQEQISKFLDLR